MLGRFKKKDENLLEFQLGPTHKLFFNSRGLIPVVVQHAKTREVLRLGYMDRLALQISLRHSIVYLCRRSNRNLQKMGERDNLEYQIKGLLMDRNKRTLLMLVLPTSERNSRSLFVYKILPRSEKSDSNESQASEE